MRSSISRFIMLTTAAGSLLLTGSSAEAAHVCRRYYLDHYEHSIRKLDRRLVAEKDRLRCRFEESRDALRHEIRHVARRLDGYERDRALRNLHYKLEDANRCYHRDLRRLHADYDDRRRHLARQRDHALRNCQTTQCTDACGIGDPHHQPHDYFIDHPHRSLPYPIPGQRDFPGARRYQHHVTRDVAPPRFDGRSPEMDWQRVLLGLLSQHWSR